MTSTLAQRVFLPVALVLFLGGCKTYEITQCDYIAGAGFKPNAYQRAAIITHHGDDDSASRNKLILEAFQVELMRRGVEVVEREKFDKAVAESLLVKGHFSDLSDTEKAVRAGKLLHVDIVFYADALINSSRFDYKGSGARVLELEQRANTTGVVEGVGVYEIHAYHDVGVTVRAIDANTGEIVWVGYRVLAVCEKVTKRSPTALTNFAAIKRLCGMILDDIFIGTKA